MWMFAGAFEGELGVQPPVGYFDPLGLSKDGDVDKFYSRRCTEIKHGRVAMWAAMGYIVPECFRWPGDCSTFLGIKFEDRASTSLTKPCLRMTANMYWWYFGFVACDLKRAVVDSTVACEEVRDAFVPDAAPTNSLCVMPLPQTQRQTTQCARCLCPRRSVNQLSVCSCLGWLKGATLSHDRPTHWFSSKAWTHEYFPPRRAGAAWAAPFCVQEFFPWVRPFARVCVG